VVPHAELSKLQHHIKLIADQFIGHPRLYA